MVATWLGCHRRAFEWFGAVSERLIIHHPGVYPRPDASAPLRSGYGFRIDRCRRPIRRRRASWKPGQVCEAQLPSDPLFSRSCRAERPSALGDAEASFRIHGTTRGRPSDEDLHDLIAERYEQVSTVVTSNLDFTEWDQAFPANRLLASATLDRLRHNAYCLVLDGQSYRAPKLAPSSSKSRVANNSKTTHS